MLYGEVRVPVEIEIRSQSRISEIHDLEVDVLVTGPGGTAWVLPAFWAGDAVFRARFGAPEAGTYTWCSRCAMENSGLDGHEGTIEICPYAGANPLYQHGRLCVAESARTFEHADGTPFLWLADTWWMGLTTRLDWPHGFRGLVEDRVRKGFSVVQFVAGPLPDFDADTHTWTREQTNEAGWPWMEREGRDPSEPPAPDDFARINPAFFDLADLRINCMIEAGLMPCILSMWGYYLPYMGVENVKRHWRNLVARYGAYPVTWCICGETLMANYGIKDAEMRRKVEATLKHDWSTIAQYVRNLDPFANLISTHPSGCNGARDMVEDDGVLDFNMLQTGHSAHESYPATLKCMANSYTREPPMPFLNSEVNYEGIMGGSWHEVQRFLFWANMLGGACGHTYGAQGLWAMNSRNDPFEGTTFDWGEGYWQDVMHYPGSTHLGLGAKFLRQYPWQCFKPRKEDLPRGRLYAHASGIPGVVAMYYFPVAYTTGEFKGMSGVPVTIYPDEPFEASWFNPRSGEVCCIGPAQPDSNGKWMPSLPSREDWVLVLENRDALGEPAG